jgi:hypothetical protein
MTHEFYRSLSNGDWVAWSAVCAAALLVISVAAVAAIEKNAP